MKKKIKKESKIVIIYMSVFVFFMILGNSEPIFIVPAILVMIGGIGYGNTIK